MLLIFYADEIETFQKRVTMWFAGNCSAREYLKEWRQLSCSRAENSAAGRGTQAAGSADRMAKFLPSFIYVTIH